MWQTKSKMLFANFILCLNIIGVVPFTWRRKTQSFVMGNTKPKIYIPYLRLACSFGHTFYLVWRVIQYVGRGRAKVKMIQLNFLIFWFIIYSLVSLLHLNTMRNSEAHVEFLNQFFLLNQQSTNNRKFCIPTAS